MSPFGSDEGRGDESVWLRVCRAIGREDLVTDPRFADNQSRVTHSDEINGIVADWIAQHSREEVAERFERHEVAFSPTRGGAPVGPFGVMGGEMQPQGHLQVVSSMVDHGLNPQSALDAPRWRVEPDGVVLEPVVGEDVVDGLRRRDHRVSVAPNRLDFGRGQIIRRLDSGVYAGGTEPRRSSTACARPATSAAPPSSRTAGNSCPNDTMPHGAPYKEFSTGELPFGTEGSSLVT